MNTYTFWGKIHPERTNITLGQLESTLFIDVNKNYRICGQLITSIMCSQISAVFKSDAKVEDIFTLKNAVMDAVRLEVDIVGYIAGCGFELEITGVLLPEGNTIIFGVEIPLLYCDYESRRNKFNEIEIIGLFKDESADYLRRCLADLRQAIRTPRDTGFFCYRAIETIKTFFCRTYNCNDKLGWEQLRTMLKINRDIIERVKQFADPVRHGDNIIINDEERGQIFQITWDIVERYIDYYKNIYSGKE